MRITLELSFLWILRAAGVLSFIINLSFYCFLFCRWRLSKNTHWFLCNFAISELIRALSVIISGVLWERRIHRDLIRNHSAVANVTDSYAISEETVENFKDIVDKIADICFSTTCVFALLILIQFYCYLKSPWSIQTFDLRGVGLVIAVWLGITAYVVLVSINAYNDMFMVFFMYNSYVSIVIDSIYLLSYIILYFMTYRLLHLNQIDLLSNMYCLGHEGVLKIVFNYRRKGIRYLLNMIVFVSISSIGDWFGSFSNFIPEIRHQFMIVIYVKKSVDIYMFLLGIAWPFIWIHLDVGMGKELRNATKYLKIPAKIENTLAKRCNTLKQIKPTVYTTQLLGQTREAVI